MTFSWWFQAESNRRHKDFQSFALPTELQNQWLRGKDLNQRPPGYGPDELPGCSTSRQDIFWEKRRNWDSNPGAGCPTYRFSRPDPSTTWVFLHVSGPWRTRTFDQSVMSRQLWPTELRVREHSVYAWSLSIRMVARVGLEPTIFRVWTDRSSQLSYLAIIWSGWQDSNLWPLDPKSSALPSCATSRLMVRRTRVELVTFWFVVKCSIQLSYRRVLHWTVPK